MEKAIIFTDSIEGKLLFPKPIRKFPKKNNNKRKIKSNSKHKNEELFISNINTKLDLENITLDEINNDFLSLAKNDEERNCFNEIYDILSREDKFISQKNKNSNIQKRNRNNFLNYRT